MVRLAFLRFPEMSTSHPPWFKFIPLAVLASLLSSPVFAQAPVLHWSFDAKPGTPRRAIWLSGGVPSIKNGTEGTATFELKTGVGEAAALFVISPALIGFSGALSKRAACADGLAPKGFSPQTQTA